MGWEERTHTHSTSRCSARSSFRFSSPTSASSSAIRSLAMALMAVFAAAGVCGCEEGWEWEWVEAWEAAEALDVCREAGSLTLDGVGGALVGSCGAGIAGGAGGGVGGTLPPEVSLVREELGPAGGGCCLAGEAPD